MKMWTGMREGRMVYLVDGEEVDEATYNEAFLLFAQRNGMSAEITSDGERRVSTDPHFYGAPDHGDGHGAPERGVLDSGLVISGSMAPVPFPVADVFVHGSGDFASMKAYAERNVDLGGPCKVHDHRPGSECSAVCVVVGSPSA